MNRVADRLTAHERLPHIAAQLEGVEWLLARDFGGLFDEVGVGKSKQCVDTGQILWQDRVLDTVLVVSPGFARSTWADEDPLLGEVAKHAWESVPNVIQEYHGDLPKFEKGALNWVVTNYEFVRRAERLQDLGRALRGRKTWLILDESWAVKSFSQQTRACMRLRNHIASRVTLLNGTPLSDGKPEDLYYPMQLLHKSILGMPNRAAFKARYLQFGGHMGQQVIGYQNLDELNAKIAPHILSRQTRDCWDLPPMREPLLIEAKLSDASWRLYRQMRDDAVAWINGQEERVSVSRQAVVKILRLAQICAGYLGGLEEAPQLTLDGLGDRPDWLKGLGDRPEFIAPPSNFYTSVTKEIGREKLDALLDYLKRGRPDKLIVWCRFTPELERATAALQGIYPAVGQLRGGQKADDRTYSKRLLAPGSNTADVAAVVGNPKAGGASLNFSGASTMVFLSSGPALIERTQSIGRIERPGQVNPMQVIDVAAMGPKGQKTIDHRQLAALRRKDDMARWTVNQWRQLLREL